MRDLTFTVLCPFSGLGGGAMGFLQAEARLFDVRARFRCLGGIDVNAHACEDFRALTGSPSLCTDIAKLTVDELRAFAGEMAPDVVFLSPPCKGASGLLSAEKARSSKYQKMNRLALDWTRLMLETWADAPPRLVLLENVPRLKQRAGRMLRAVRGLLHRAGYVFSDGFHDCGEIGGLAQTRRRYLLVARHAKRVPPLLYQPPKKRVRACGEVLSQLPMPTTPEAAEYGRLHELPRLSWLNWVRLALIPAGGDWRDLPGVLEEEQARREIHRRHHVEDWKDPSVTIAGSGSNGPSAVADPRGPDWYRGTLGVQPWDEPAGTVTGNARPSTGTFSVADPRAFKEGYGVLDFGEPSGTVTGEASVSGGRFSVADPRVGRFGNVDRVTPWEEPVGTVTHSPAPSSGGASVSDPRVKTAYDHGYRILRWDEPSFTIAGGSHPGQGAYSVGDVRVTGTPRAGAYGVIPWHEAAKTVTGVAGIDNGAWAVADPRTPESPVMMIRDIRKPPPAVPVIVSEDGTWHRPVTTLELAALQDLPTRMPDGSPLSLAGKSQTGWRERIGNAVPRAASRAIAEQMLVTLVHSELERFAMSGDLDVWVAPEKEAVVA